MINEFQPKEEAETTAEPIQEQPKPAAEPQAEPKAETTGGKSFLDDVKVSSEDIFNSHFESLKQPKQEYEEAVKATEKLFTTEPKQSSEKTEGTTGTTDEPKAEKTNAQTEEERRKNAERLAKTGDMIVALVGYIKFDVAPEKIKAKPSEIDEITDSIKDCLESYGSDFKMPGWLKLVIALALVYGFKIFLIVREKRAEEEAKRQAEARRFEEENQGQTAHERFKNNFTKETEPEVKMLTHKCALPTCKKQIPLSRKYCCKSHSATHTNSMRVKPIFKV
jgi:hypothetical protein